MKIFFDNAAKQLSAETTVANLFDMEKNDFDLALKAIRKEYKKRHNLFDPDERHVAVDGQKAFILVLKTAKKIQDFQRVTYGIDISAEQAVEGAIIKLSKKTDKKPAKLVDYNKFMWLQHFADRIATVLQSAKFDAECEQQHKDRLLIAQNAVWKGYRDDDTSTTYSDYIIRHGIHGEEWKEYEHELFDNGLICDYLKESKRYTHLEFDRDKYLKVAAPENEAAAPEEKVVA